MSNTAGTDYNPSELKQKFILAQSNATGWEDALAYILGLKAGSGTSTKRGHLEDQIIPLPLTSAIDIATGALCAVFANGASTTPGTQLTNSKAVCIRWNNDAAPGAIAITVPYTLDLDDGEAIVFEALVSKTGATVGDATKLTVGAFEQTVAALHDADSDFGGDTDAVVGDATAKTVSKLSLTLTAANVHAAPAALTVTIKPKAGTLGTDDFLLHAAWLKVVRKPLLG